MSDQDFVYLLPKQSWRGFLRTWRRRRKRDMLHRDLNAVTRKNLLEDGMRHLAVYGFDGNSNLINVYGFPDREEMDLLFRYLADNDLIRGAAIDVGANVGMHAIRFAKHFDAVYAFEPHPVTYALLQMNLEHYAPAAKAFRLAAGSSSGTTMLYENRLQNMGAPSLSKSDTVYAAHEIEIQRLDDLTELRDVPIGLIKVDTEGHELGVFKGAVELIRANKPVLLFEDWGSKDGVPSPVIDFLRTLGYSQFLVPEVFPVPHPNRLIRLMHVVRQGASMGLRACDFSSKRGYELVLALPDAGVRPKDGGARSHNVH